MPAPRQIPIGLLLQNVAKDLNRAFDEALAARGGSVPTWQILLLLKSQEWGNQRRLADALGIKAATLTHHLDALEKQELIERVRDPENRRIIKPQLTAKGKELFNELREAAVEFDQRLRSDLNADEEQVLRDLLGRLGP